MGSNTGGSSIPRIMVFQPTLAEMKDFSAYIGHMESKGAHKAGLAKIIPPKEWIPRKAGYDEIDLTIPSPIEQVVHGRQGLYQQFNIQKKAMKVEEFRKLAETSRYRTPAHFDYEDLERKYWKNISFNSPIYGADVSGSLYDPGVDEFNINHLNTILDLVGNDYGIKIEGVNTAYLYFGMWKTTFAWHTEDMDLYSINYLHFGAPKSWYAIPPEHGRRLERLAAGFFQPSFQSCSAFLRHKMTLISPQILKQYSIPFNRITQEPGEFMITFPFGYHAGFNHGFNCAESTNFATQRWVEYGKRALQCTCRKDGVKIGMEVFVRNFQPDRYELWLEGKDVGAHPEDPTKCSAAPAPSKAELSFYRQEGKRQYKFEPSAACSSVSKRLPIAKVVHKKEPEDDDGITSSSSSSCGSSSSSDTEVYDVPPEAVQPEKKRKAVDWEKAEKTRGLTLHCKKVVRHEPVIKKKKPRKKSTSPPRLKPFFHESRAKESNSSRKFASYSSLVSQEGPLRLIISKQSKDDLVADLKTKPTQSSLIPASLLPLQHAAIAKCSSETQKCAKTIESLADPMVMVESNPAYFPISNIYHPPSQLVPHVRQANMHLSGEQPVAQTVISHGAAVKAVATLAPKQDIETVLYALGTSVIPLDLKASNPSVSTNQVAHFLSSNESSQYRHKDPHKINQYSSSSSCVVAFKKENLEMLDKPKSAIPPQPASVESDSDDTVTSTSSEEPVKKLQVPKAQSWAKSLNDLWQHKPSNFDKERGFNLNQSMIAPHCSICSIFRPFNGLEDAPSQDLPVQSKVWMPGSAYADSLTAIKEVIDMNNHYLSCDGASQLLQCVECNVCIHAVCYGVMENVIPGTWKCDRCRIQARTAQCCACSLRGGALKLTTDANTKWIHVLCAVLLPGVIFTNVTSKDKIDLAKASQKNRTLSCFFCQRLFRSSVDKYRPRKGLCIKCTSGKCNLSFHVTCAHAAGVEFEVQDWPNNVRVTCNRHKRVICKEKLKRTSNLTAGEKVIAKHRDGNYHEAVLMRIQPRTYVSVDFEDGTFSENLFPEDIVERDGPDSEELKIGEFVKVKWTDDKIYGATFKGKTTNVTYLIQFRDKSQKQLKRNCFYTRKEKLPNKVRSRLVR